MHYSGNNVNDYLFCDFTSKGNVEACIEQFYEEYLAKLEANVKSSAFLGLVMMGVMRCGIPS